MMISEVWWVNLKTAQAILILSKFITKLLNRNHFNFNQISENSTSHKLIRKRIFTTYLRDRALNKEDFSFHLRSQNMKVHRDHRWRFGRWKFYFPPKKFGENKFLHDLNKFDDSLYAFASFLNECHKNGAVFCACWRWWDLLVTTWERVYFYQPNWNRNLKCLVLKSLYCRFYYLLAVVIS